MKKFNDQNKLLRMQTEELQIVKSEFSLNLENKFRLLSDLEKEKLMNETE